MNAEVATGAWLIAVPLAFNAAFLELERTLDYPNILRKEPDASFGASPRPAQALVRRRLLRHELRGPTQGSPEAVT